MLLVFGLYACILPRVAPRLQASRTQESHRAVLLPVPDRGCRPRPNDGSRGCFRVCVSLVLPGLESQENGTARAFEYRHYFAKGSRHAIIIRTAVCHCGQPLPPPVFFGRSFRVRVLPTRFSEGSRFCPAQGVNPDVPGAGFERATARSSAECSPGLSYPGTQKFFWSGD